MWGEYAPSAGAARGWPESSPLHAALTILTKLSSAFASAGTEKGLGRSGVMLVLRGRQPKGDPLPHVHLSRPPVATASHGGRSPVLAEREASTQVPGEEGVELRLRPTAKEMG